MDLQQSWERCEEQLSSVSRNAYLRLCIDGGRRSGTNSAMGMALYAVSVDSAGLARYKLLARKGALLGAVASAFLTEALALEWGLQYLVGLMRTGVTRANA